MGERRRAGVPQTIGGVLVGFDEQVWSQRPPAQERVEQVDRMGTVVTPGGLSIELPPGAGGAASRSDEAADEGGDRPGGA